MFKFSGGDNNNGRAQDLPKDRIILLDTKKPFKTPPAIGVLPACFLFGPSHFLSFRILPLSIRHNDNRSLK